jgi:hypothetical protein
MGVVFIIILEQSESAKAGLAARRNPKVAAVQALGSRCPLRVPDPNIWRL